MRCLHCFKPLTPENQATVTRELPAALRSLQGRPLPYCSDCIQEYKQAALLKHATPGERTKWLLEARAGLERGQPYSLEQIDDARARLFRIGLDAQEINNLLADLEVRP